MFKKCYRTQKITITHWHVKYFLILKKIMNFSFIKLKNVLVVQTSMRYLNESKMLNKTKVII